MKFDQNIFSREIVQAVDKNETKAFDNNMKKEIGFLDRLQEKIRNDISI